MINNLPSDLKTIICSRKYKFINDIQLNGINVIYL